MDGNLEKKYFLASDKPMYALSGVVRPDPDETENRDQGNGINSAQLLEYSILEWGDALDTQLCHLNKPEKSK